MKVFFTIFLFCVSFSSYGQSSDILVGNWLEYWYPTGDESDVTYSNTMQISLDRDGDFVIKCTDDDIYAFDNIVFEDGILTFRKENIQSSEEGEDGKVIPFYIYYSLVIVDDGTVMKGGIVNSVQQTNPIKWTKSE